MDHASVVIGIKYRYFGYIVWVSNDWMYASSEMRILRSSVNSWALHLLLKRTKNHWVWGSSQFFLPFYNEKGFSLLRSWKSQFCLLRCTGSHPVRGVCLLRKQLLKECIKSRCPSYKSAHSIVNKLHKTFQVPLTDVSVRQGREVLWRHNGWSQRRTRIRELLVMNVAIFWDIASCGPYKNRSLEFCLARCCTLVLARLILEPEMEVIRSSETSIQIRITRHCYSRRWQHS
jgi:hypothetical protein